MIEFAEWFPECLRQQAEGQWELRDARPIVERLCSGEKAKNLWEKARSTLSEHQLEQLFVGIIWFTNTAKCNADEPFRGIIKDFMKERSLAKEEGVSDLMPIPNLDTPERRRRVLAAYKVNEKDEAPGEVSGIVRRLTNWFKCNIGTPRYDITALILNTIYHVNKFNPHTVSDLDPTC